MHQLLHRLRLRSRPVGFRSSWGNDTINLDSGGVDGIEFLPGITPDQVALWGSGVNLFVLLNQFRLADTPYPSRPWVEFASRYSDYDHLARVKEWSRGGGDGA
jgi:hypothetical protein